MLNRSSLSITSEIALKYLSVPNATLFKLPFAWPKTLFKVLKELGNVLLCLLANLLRVFISLVKAVVSLRAAFSSLEPATAILISTL